MITLYKGDCLEEMSKIADGSVDLILTDLPYGTTACKWDVVIPFAPLWEHYWRVLKTSGAVVLFGSEPFSSYLRMSQIKYYKYDWIWVKPKGTGHLNAKKMPMNDYEVISVFQKKLQYNPQFSKGSKFRNKAGKNIESCSSMTDCYGAYTNFRNDNEGTRYPKRVIHFGVVERGTVHPTQKPVPLLEYLIKTYTNEGETVLDSTMGSGSTGVACVNTGRSFIGIEKDDKYFEIAENRISTAKEPQ